MNSLLEYISTILHQFAEMKFVNRAPLDAIIPSQYCVPRTVVPTLLTSRYHEANAIGYIPTHTIQLLPRVIAEGDTIQQKIIQVQSRDRLRASRRYVRYCRCMDLVIFGE